MDAVSVHMNMLRVCGAAALLLKEDALYDACDEMGILLWVDMKFACTTYPAYDPAFMDNVHQEIQDNEAAP